MGKPFGGVVLKSAFRVIVPFTIVYGVYVLTHGEFSPGGGFQAGALLAIGIVLARLVQGQDAKFNVKGKHAVMLAGIGAFIYAATGFLPLFFGGNFLEYSCLPVHMHEAAEVHALGILMIEIGVTLTVMMTIIDIMDALIRESDSDE